MHVLHQAGHPEVDNQIVVEIPMKIKKASYLLEVRSL